MDNAKNIFVPIITKKVTGFALDELEEKMNEESGTDENKDIKEEITSVVSKGVESLLKKTWEFYSLKRLIYLCLYS